MRRDRWRSAAFLLLIGGMVSSASYASVSPPAVSTFKMEELLARIADSPWNQTWWGQICISVITAIVTALVFYLWGFARGRLRGQAERQYDIERVLQLQGGSPSVLLPPPATNPEDGPEGRS